MTGTIEILSSISESMLPTPRRTFASGFLINGGDLYAQFPLQARPQVADNPLTRP